MKTSQTLKKITIDNFSGGRDSMTDPTLLQNNQCVSGSRNVWTPYGNLTKIPGCSILLSTTASANNVAWSSVFSDDTVNSSFLLYHRLTYPTGGYAGSTGTFFPWAGQTDSLTPLGYTTGTISVSGVSLISATGNGTLWSSNISSGDVIAFSTTSSAYFHISSVEDDTHFTLATALSVAIPTGTSYKILPPLTYVESPVASLNGFVSWCSTADVMQQYDGNGMLRRTSAPKSAYLSVHKSYLFAARTTTAQSRLYWSALSDPTSWPVNNFIDIDIKKGVITGMAPFGTELIIFKSRSMYRVVGDVFDPTNPTYSVIPVAVPSYFTFNANSSIAVLTNQNPWYGRMIFWSQDNIFLYLQGTNYITNLSNKIRKDFPIAVISGSLFDSMPNNAQNVRGYVFKDYYILRGFGSLSSSQSAAFISDLTGAWWYVFDDNQPELPSPFCSAAPIAITQITQSNSIIISPSSTLQRPGRLYSMDMTGPTYLASTVNNADSSSIAINGVWVSKEFNIEYGTFKWIVIYLQKQSAGNLVVQWSIDQASAVSQNIDMTAGRGRIIRSVIPINQKGTTIQLTLSNNVVNQTFNIFAINIFYESSDMERIS